MKIKRINQIPGKKGLKTIEKLINSSENIIEESLIFDQYPFENTESKLSFKDSKRWNDFRHRYEDEFDEKLRLMDEIMSHKKDKIKVTWISLF